MNVVKLLLPLFLSLSLASCFSPSKPTIHFASKNSVAIKYHAYDMLPTVTAEAIDMAVEHCKKHWKGMKLISSNAANPMTTAEIHTFMCTNDFVDKRIEVKVKE